MKILYNARIHTLDKFRPVASVIVIDGDRVAALGGSELLQAYATLDPSNGRLLCGEDGQPCGILLETVILE